LIVRATIRANERQLRRNAVHTHLAKEWNMKRLMTCAVMLALATAIAGCGASGSTSSAAAAASAGAATKADMTPASGATTVAGTAVATPTSAPVAGGDTCKFLSAADAAALVANPGAVKVVAVNGPISIVTSCTWGSVAVGHILLVANELNSSAPAAEIKAAMVGSLTEQIAGLGDVGGFMTKTSTDVTVAFFKGSTQVTLAVSATGVNADAVVAAAKKIANGV
jgi:hypothetical protein